MSSSNVDLTIAGRRFTIACAPGEEAHITRLGAAIDARARQQGSLGSQSGERILLYAALLLADELHEAKAALGDASAIEPLENIATRLEGLAERLESETNTP